MYRGYIKLYRAIVDTDLWLSEPFTKSQAWIDLILLTNHTDGEMTLRNGEILEIKRGECGYSMITLADRWSWSRGKVKRFFDYLKTRKMIQQKELPKTTIIKLLNYDKFQNNTTNETTNSTTNSTTNDTTNSTLTRMVKNDKNEEEVVVVGKYNNVHLTQHNYNKLLSMCLNQTFLDELVDDLSTNIEEGTEKPFRQEFPNAHYIRLTKYREFRIKNPDKFRKESTNGTDSYNPML